MAIKWVGGLAAVVLAFGVGTAQLWSDEPEGCPEDGCRVGYRFEDGGKDPEGWEPYQTDDPVVALMDACLTYFMTGQVRGDVQGTTRLSNQTSARSIELVAAGEALRIFNSPPNDWGTFSCRGELTVADGNFESVVDWLETQLQRNADWYPSHYSSDVSVSSVSSVVFVSDTLESRLNVELRPSEETLHPEIYEALGRETRQIGSTEIFEVLPSLSFHLQSQNHGPQSLAVSVPDIVF